MATILELTDYYKGLLAHLYRDKPKASAMIALFTKQMLADNFVEAVGAAYDIETAVGVQLDVLGKYIGVPRNIGDPTPADYYGFWDMEDPGSAAQNLNGFTDYEDFSTNENAVWYQYQFNGRVNTDLSDTSYRFILKLKVALNMNNSTLFQIQAFLATFFPGQVMLVDNADMTMDYYVSQDIPVGVSVVTPFLPKPMGVGITVTVVPSADPFSLGILNAAWWLKADAGVTTTSAAFAGIGTVEVVSGAATFTDDQSGGISAGDTLTINGNPYTVDSLDTGTTATLDPLTSEAAGSAFTITKASPRVLTVADQGQNAVDFETDNATSAEKYAQPVLLESAVGGNPAFVYDGVDDFTFTPASYDLATELGITQEATFIYVINNNSEGIIGQAIPHSWVGTPPAGDPDAGNYTVTIWRSFLAQLQTYLGRERLSTSNFVPYLNQWIILTVVVRNKYFFGYANGLLIATNNTVSEDEFGILPGNSVPIETGRTDDGFGNSYGQFQMAEQIVTSFALNDSLLSQAHKYLSTKYGITLSN